MNKLQETILYTLVTEPGGVDGRDPGDKGGTVVKASYDKAEITGRKGFDSRYRVETQIVDEKDLRAALTKLTPVERYMIQHAVRDGRAIAH